MEVLWVSLLEVLWVSSLEVFWVSLLEVLWISLFEVFWVFIGGLMRLGFVGLSQINQGLSLTSVRVSVTFERSNTIIGISNSLLLLTIIIFCAYKIREE